MPKVVITHSVVDVDNWLKGKSERADAIGGMGGANVVDHVASDGSKTIAITLNTEDVAGLVAALGAPSAEVKAAMDRHGVLPPVAVYVEK
jgi:hypothetical protein